MTIFIVIAAVCDEHWIKDVFATRELAQAFIDSLTADYLLHYTIQEWEVKSA